MSNNIRNTPLRLLDARPARQNEMQQTHTSSTKNGKHIAYALGVKSIGDLDVLRSVVLSRGNATSFNSIAAKIRMAGDESYKPYMHGTVALNVKDLIKGEGLGNDNKSSPLLDNIMEALIKDDGSVLTKLAESPDNAFHIHLGELTLQRYTDSPAENPRYPHKIEDQGRISDDKDDSKWVRTERVSIDELDGNEILKDEVSDKLNSDNEAHIYVKLDKQTEDIVVTGFDEKTGEQYNATIPRASVIEAKQKAAEAAAKEAAEAAAKEAAEAAAKEAAEAAAKEAAEAAAKEAAEAAVKEAAEAAVKEAAEAAVKEAAEAAAKEVAEPAAKEVAEPAAKEVAEPAALSGSESMRSVLSGSESMRSVLSGSESMRSTRPESSHSVLNNAGFIEKHSHMTSDKRALLAIAALVVAGVATEAIGSGIAGSEAADDKDAADDAEQDAIANNPDSLAIANQEAQQAYADALNAGNADNIENPGTNTMYMDENGTWMVLDTPTEKGQEQIDAAQVRYDADIATYNEKMAEHDKLLKDDMGKITTSIAGIFLGAAAGTAATKYILDVSHNHSGKHDIDGATPMTSV